MDCGCRYITYGVVSILQYYNQGNVKVVPVVMHSLVYEAILVDRVIHPAIIDSGNRQRTSPTPFLP